MVGSVFKSDTALLDSWSTRFTYFHEEKNTSAEY